MLVPHLDVMAVGFDEAGLQPTRGRTEADKHRSGTISRKATLRRDHATTCAQLAREDPTDDQRHYRGPSRRACADAGREVRPLRPARPAVHVAAAARARARRADPAEARRTATCTMPAGWGPGATRRN